MCASSEIIESIEEGKVIYLEKEIQVKELAWNPHPNPTSRGVFLKDLVKGESTDSKFSSHLVKIEPGGETGEHIHQDNWEVHEIIGGSGKAILGNKEATYKVGVSAVIPQGTKHKVVADEKGLYILSKFIPALV